jgi:hypothetical protein
MAPEPPEVQDAILRAVRGLLSGAQDAWGQNGDAAGAESPDLLVVSGSVRASVRLARVLGPEVFDRWLQSAVVAGRRARLDCAVLVACRVLRPDDVALRLRTIRFPAIAIDLIEARSFGAFPCAVSEEMFGTFLR